MPRIAYADPDELDDPELRAALEDAMLHSTPRPEIQAIRARQPEVPGRSCTAGSGCSRAASSTSS